ncbi:MAG: DUF4232 domain-containing protein [Frankia sp.]|nr:DUF4232 domain-containing protein [Frankia sp.]
MVGRGERRAGWWLRPGRTAGLAAALGTALVLAAAGCGGSDDGAGPGGGAPPATSGPAGTPSAGPTAAGVLPTCQTSVLAASLVGSEGAAGTVYATLALTNQSTAPCVLRGFPGVSFVDAAGNQLGAPADRDGEAGQVVELAGDGGRAEFAVAITQPGLLPGCEAQDSFVEAANLRIYPPDNTAALLVPAPEGRQACADPAVHQLRVRAVTPG